jgi:hypothetical protein
VDPSGHVADPYGQPNDPYGQTADPYGPTADPYGQANEPNPPGAAPSAPAAPSRPGEYPTAQRTAKANQVISPYEPYNIIDVEGFASGQLARDPSNKKIFRVP